MRAGRDPSGRALTVPVEPASSLAPSGFDPSRDLWVRFSDDRMHIRQWSSAPFEGALRFRFDHGEVGEPDRRVWPLGGYAPGWYMGKCRDCGEELIADKRASQCLDCAVIAANDRIAAADALTCRAATVEMRLRIALANELRRNGVADDVVIKLVGEADGGPVLQGCAQ